MPVDPRPMLKLGDGARYVVIAEHQEGVRPLPAIVIEDQAQEGVREYVLTRWHLTDEERSRIRDGDDVWVIVSTYGQALQPMRLATTPAELVE